MVEGSKTKHNGLRVARIALATVVMLAITLMFLDFTGTLHHYFSWLAQVQLLPAVLASNFIIVAVILLLTFVFGRVYCSVICPLGIMQDLFHRLGAVRKKNRYAYHKANNILRYVVLAVFIVLMVAGAQSLALLIAPYSAYGRIVSSLFAPIYNLINNAFAAIAEHFDSYAFYSTDVYLKSGITLAVALITFLTLALIAFFRGRLYCNTICPVGSLLSLISRYSLMAPVIDNSKCTKCKKCEHNCKAECINIGKKGEQATIDYSRCVDCMDCLEQCRFAALKYQWRGLKRASAAQSQPAEQQVPTAQTTAQAQPTTEPTIDTSRRSFITTTATIAAVAAVQAQHKTTDGGLAFIEQKKVPKRAVELKPAGSVSLRHFSQHCTACQLCVTACPNQVLRPANDLLHLMQPQMSYERGYCPTDCTRCADVCPTNAILPITEEQKINTQIGHAVWIKQNCVVLTDHVSCGNCARHCPVHAIMMVQTEEGEVPAVDQEKCIGCGKCEYVCPARPFSAIYVEGHEVHKEI